jgi:hypothetical protein
MKVGGRVEHRFEPVHKVFGRVLAGQAGTGAAVAAWSDGAWVVDLWGGWADAAGGGGRIAWCSLIRSLSRSPPYARWCWSIAASWSWMRR